MTTIRERLLPAPRVLRPESKAFYWALAAFLPLFVWWLGWFPGFLSSDSIDQLTQADNGKFTNFHPAIHTMYLWLITRVWDTPGAVTLVQIAAMAGMLALVARRLVQVGAPVWAAVGAAWVVASLPPVTTTTITIWKDVPYTLAVLWVFSELLGMARDPDRFWTSRWGPVRLGLGISLMWMLRLNGFLTVGLLAVGLAIGFRRHLRRLAIPAAVLVLSFVAVQVVLYELAPVDRVSIAPGQVYIGDIAASLTHEPGNFSPEELDYLATIAPLDVWTSRYDCYDSNLLSFDSQFDDGAIRDSSGRFAALAIKAIVRDLDTVLGHRACATSYLWWPPQDDDAYFHRPPFEIAANDLGIERNPISDRAFSVTFDIFQWVEPNGRLWLTWRPALAVWAGVIVYAGVALRRRLRPLLWGGLLLGAQLANVAVTTPLQEFRAAFAIYLLALLSVPLLWLVARPGDAELVEVPLQD